MTLRLLFLLCCLLALPPGRGIAACGETGLPVGELACRIDTALAAGDPTVCLEAEAPSVVFNCVGRYAEETGDVEACDLLAGQVPDTAPMPQAACRAGVAVAAGDPALCAAIGSGPLRGTCYLLLVAEHGDTRLCDRIETPELRRSCRD